MGKITTTGQAERYINADRAEYNICFTSRASQQGKAISKAKEQCERFLEKMVQQGADITSFHLQQDQIRRFESNGNLLTEVQRNIQFKAKASSALNDCLLAVLESGEYDCTFNVDYSLSNLKEIHDELLLEAVNDSKQKAEAIAKATNQKIIGIDSVNDQERYVITRDDAIACKMGDFNQEKCSLSNQLATCEELESESIVITWLIA